MSDLIDRAEAISRAVELRMYGKPVKMVPVSELERLSSAQVDVTDINVGDINKFIDGLEEIFADIRERHVDDSVCGLCEYDGAYMGQSGDWCNECPGFDRDDCFKLSDECRKRWIDTITNSLLSARAELGENSPSEQAQMNEFVVKTGETCADTISRQAAIEKFEPWLKVYGYSEGELNMLKAVLYELRFLPPAQPEQLTDKEQRIFLAAMGREEEVCEEVDRNRVREPYEDSLMRVCKEIRRKVKGALWT